MRVTTRTHQGHVRSINQDSILCMDKPYGLYGVADGMGGHQAGEVASRMAAILLMRVLEGAVPDESLLRGGMEEVNQLIFEEQGKHDELKGMGTTLTVLWEDGDKILLGHVGDSRAYRLRSGEIVQLTTDHSMVGELLRAGYISEEEAARHPYRNVITRAVGTAASIEIDVSTLDKLPGDRYLVCSDGLTEYADAGTIRRILSTRGLEDAADELLDIALEGGGRDNITLLIAEAPR